MIIVKIKIKALYLIVFFDFDVLLQNVSISVKMLIFEFYQKSQKYLRAAPKIKITSV